jgi:hypothetical protein
MMYVTRGHRCVVCGRENTLLVRLSAGRFPDTSHRWSCWRPSHLRRAGQLAERSAQAKAAFRERWGIPA